MIERSIGSPPKINLESAIGLADFEAFSHGRAGAINFGAGTRSSIAKIHHRGKTQTDQRAARKISNLRNSVACTTLEPIQDRRYILPRDQRPGGKNDGSLNQSFNLNIVQKKYHGLE